MGVCNGEALASQTAIQYFGTKFVICHCKEPV